MTDKTSIKDELRKGIESLRQKISKLQNQSKEIDQTIEEESERLDEVEEQLNELERPQTIIEDFKPFWYKSNKYDGADYTIGYVYEVTLKKWGKLDLGFYNYKTIETVLYYKLSFKIYISKRIQMVGKAFNQTFEDIIKEKAGVIITKEEAEKEIESYLEIGKGYKKIINRCMIE